MLTLKPLSPAELDDFYPLLQAHFPPSEIKKLPHFHQLIDAGVYEMWKLVEEDTVRGLALFVMAPGARYAISVISPGVRCQIRHNILDPKFKPFVYGHR